ncbi:hypothetical protein RchiOBHm_Chr7g0217721 [Rosa chinensis]|uniref:Transmembrane protein n=1 Tax=Rosa chinensis TaxID=74649 RepID=A0A2P6PC40_ROSCH|nr:hypothetical protein RchiOBHm_Chr7g0217721 [Rosa chinensis]
MGGGGMALAWLRSFAPVVFAPMVFCYGLRWFDSTGSWEWLSSSTMACFGFWWFLLLNISVFLLVVSF